ncbi:MAG: HAD family phosphatase [Syntrophomonadaceae bacterium]|jgi:Cof subfamily protein (haloacid dehalogenase superfamily)|nr:HAD family phosphatase [Syntrophomonadaceae bacterium]
MSIKMVAIDLDDTLLDSQHRIPSSCISAIQRVKALGVYIILATGRMFRAALPYAQQLELDLPLITYQGALVKNSGSGDIWYERPIRSDLALELIDFLEFNQVDYHIYCNDQIYSRKMMPVLKTHTRITGIEPIITRDIPGLVAETPPLEIMAVLEKDQLGGMEAVLREQYGPELHLTPFKYNTLEIMDAGATKAKALAAVATALRIEPQEVMAIGDSHNDLPMIKWAGMGVAVGNAHSQVKEAADFVAGSNDEGGVIQALEKFITKDR